MRITEQFITSLKPVIWRSQFFLQRLKSKQISEKTSEAKYDLVLVIIEKGRGWILEAICNHIKSQFAGNAKIVYSTRNLPSAKAYFFTHFAFYLEAARRNPLVWKRKSFVFFTHPKASGIPESAFRFGMKNATKIFAMCSSGKSHLVSKGIPSDKIELIYGGADPQRFLPHNRGTNTVGFVSAYYERKSPDVILELVKLLPNVNFRLLGKNWENWSRFEELRNLPNFQYCNFEYDEYPQFYRSLDVFVSPSKLEGGPIPLIEAMMCNVVPVASKTGFAPDIIQHDVNGFLFEIEASPSEIAKLVNKALTSEKDVASTVQHLTWKNFEQKISKQI